MHIEAVEQLADHVVVRTTGTEYRLLPGLIAAYTRIPDFVHVADLSLTHSEQWSVSSSNDDEVTLNSGSCQATLGSDGFLALRGHIEQEVSVDCRFDVLERVENECVRDWRGSGFGFGVYRRPRDCDARARTQRFSDSQPFYFHVFPPREPDLRRAGLRIAHEGRPDDARCYPSDELIKNVSDHAEIFALHAYFWRETDRSLRPRFSRYRFRRCPWFSAEHIVDDESEFRRVRESVKDAGMSFVPYVSPRYSTAPDMLAELKRLLARYDFDGFYLDGLAGDFVEQRQFIRALRADLGWDRIIYLNGSDQPFGSPLLTAPFIDTHCDFVLRGDSGRGGLERDEFLRRCVSGQGGGNQVGVWCHYGSSGWPFPFDRVPCESDQKAAASAGVRIWRRSFWWPGAAALARFDQLNIS